MRVGLLPLPLPSPPKNQQKNARTQRRRGGREGKPAAAARCGGGEIRGHGPIPEAAARGRGVVQPPTAGGGAGGGREEMEVVGGYSVVCGG